jgi:hypothetical protein
MVRWPGPGWFCSASLAQSAWCTAQVFQDSTIEERSKAQLKKVAEHFGATFRSADRFARGEFGVVNVIGTMQPKGR